MLLSASRLTGRESFESKLKLSLTGFPVKLGMTDSPILNTAS